MDERFVERRKVREFDATTVKEHVVGFLVITTFMGVVGFIAGIWKLVNDFDVQRREDVNKLDDRLDSLETKVNGFDSSKLESECALLQNDMEHWVTRIVRNEQGLHELELEIRNLITEPKWPKGKQ